MHLPLAEHGASHHEWPEYCMQILTQKSVSTWMTLHTPPSFWHWWHCVGPRHFDAIRLQWGQQLTSIEFESVKEGDTTEALTQAIINLTKSRFGWETTLHVPMPSTSWEYTAMPNQPLTSGSLWHTSKPSNRDFRTSSPRLHMSKSDKRITIITYDKAILTAWEEHMKYVVPPVGIPVMDRFSFLFLSNLRLDYILSYHT